MGVVNTTPGLTFVFSAALFELPWQSGTQYKSKHAPFFSLCLHSSFPLFFLSLSVLPSPSLSFSLSICLFAPYPHYALSLFLHSNPPPPLTAQDQRADVDVYDTSTFSFLFDLWTRQWLTVFYPAACIRAGAENLSATVANAQAPPSPSTLDVPARSADPPETHLAATTGSVAAATTPTAAPVNPATPTATPTPPHTATPTSTLTPTSTHTATRTRTATAGSADLRHQRPSTEALKQPELRCHGAVHTVIVRWYVLWMTSPDPRCRAVRQLLQRDPAALDIMHDIFRLTLAGHYGRKPTLLATAAKSSVYRHHFHGLHTHRSSHDASISATAAADAAGSSAASASGAAGGGSSSGTAGGTGGTHDKGDPVSIAAAAFAGGADGGTLADSFDRLPHQVLLVFKAWLTALEVRDRLSPEAALDVRDRMLPGDTRGGSTTRATHAFASASGLTAAVGTARGSSVDREGGGDMAAPGTPDSVFSASGLESSTSRTRAEVLADLGSIHSEALVAGDGSFLPCTGDALVRLLRRICESVFELFHIPAHNTDAAGRAHDDIVSLVRDGLSIYQRVCMGFAADVPLHFYVYFLGVSGVVLCRGQVFLKRMAP